MLSLHRFAVGFSIVTASITPIKMAEASQTLLSDFDDGSLSGWVFTNGPEFPGAQGSMTGVTGQSGIAAHLAYDLSKGGNYVGATLGVSALKASALGLWLRSSINTKARVRVGDAGGQTLQYDVVRPLEGSLDPAAWYRVVLDLSTPSTYYGGANDGVPHLPLSSIGLLAVPETGTSGFLDFDEVTAINGALEVSLDPEVTPLLAAPTDAAELKPRLAVNLHTTTNSRAIDLARDAGFSVVRLDLLWQHSELTPGVYNFQEFDGFVDDLLARGMRLHMILDYSNPLYPPVTAPEFANVTIPAFAALARATARHFVGKHLSYEIWNEPNSPTFWPTEAGTGLYSELCQAAIDAVHAGDPDALVTTGGTSGFDYTFLQELLTKGGADAANAVAVHPYRKSGGESVGHDLVLLREMIRSRFKTPPPVWNTEWGYSSTWNGNGHGTAERSRQAQLVTRELLSAWAMGFPLIVYYDLNDGGTDPMNAENNFGLLTADNADKPAMVAVRTLSDAANGRRYKGLLQTQTSGLHAMKLDGAADTTLAIWTDDPSRDTLVHLPGSATAVDYLGNALALSANGAGRDVTVRETAGPVYVKLPATTTRDVSSSTGGAGNSVGSTSADSTSRGGNGAISGGPQGAPESVNETTNPGCTCSTTVPQRPLTAWWTALAAAWMLGMKGRRAASKRHRC